MSARVWPVRLQWSTVGVRIFSPEERPTDDVLAFVGFAQSRGAYPGVFDYKFDKFPTSHLSDLHYWAILLWDRIILRVVFHDLGCECSTCGADRRLIDAGTSSIV
jgi:hypothetical protein